MSLGATNLKLCLMIHDERKLVLRDPLATEYVRNVGVRQRLTSLFCKSANNNLVLHFQFGRDKTGELNLPSQEQIELIRNSPHASISLSIVGVTHADIDTQTFAGLPLE